MPLNSVDTANSYLLSFRRGEEKGFDYFFHQLYPSLCYFACSITHSQEASEEIASEAFIKIWKRHEQFSNAKVIKAYLYQIVKNDSFKWIRLQNKIDITSKAIAAIADESGESHFENIIRAEVMAELYSAICALPTACRNIFEKLYVEGKSVNETASELDISPSTVRNQKARGLQILRKKIAL